MEILELTKEEIINNSKILILTIKNSLKYYNIIMIKNTKKN
jgi:hypothetical protein